MPKTPEQIKKTAERVTDSGSTSLAQLDVTMEISDKLEDIKEMMSEKPEREEVQKVELVQGEQDEMATAFFSMLKGKPGKDGKTPIKGEDYFTEDEIKSFKEDITPKKGEDYFDGKDYILTSKDKKEIASKIEVPIVEKIIEKTETIVEQPIIKEVAVADTREMILEKINSGTEEDLKISLSQIEKGFALLSDLESFSQNVQRNISNIRIPKGGGGSGGIEVLSNGVTVGKGSALNFVGASVTNTDGHITTITVTGGSIGGSITGGTEGSVLFLGAGGVLAQDNANLFWDDTNNRLGLGTVAPLQRLSITGTDSGGSGSIENTIRLTPNPSNTSYYADIQSYYNNTNWLKINKGASNYITFGDYVIYTASGKKLGVGATPTYTFDVNNSIAGDLVSRISNTSATGYGLLLKGGATDGTTYALSIQNAAGTDLVRVTGGGNVGIGTTSPGAKLDVFANLRISSATDNILQFRRTDSNTNYGSKIWTTGSFAQVVTIDFDSENQSTYGGFNITSHNGANNLFNIIDNGNVGIGTTVPSYNLQVHSTTGNSIIGVDAYDNSSNGIIKFVRAGIDSELLKITSDFAGASTASGWSMNFYANTATPTMTIKNGNVGIGTTSPLAQLQINTSSASTIGQIIKGYASQTASLTEWQNSAGAVLARVDEVGDFVTSGSFYTDSGVANTSTGNNAFLGMVSTGPYITRNIADTNPALYVRQVHASSTGDILQLRNSANTSLFNVSYDGKVGIGTTTVGSKLTIGSTVADAVTPIIDITSDTTTIKYPELMKFTASSGGSMRFNGGASGGFYPQIVFTAQTTGAVAGLGGGFIAVTGTDSQYAGGTGVFSIDGRLSGGALATANIFSVASYGNVKMVVGASGNIGIGTTSPGAQLQINTSSASVIGQIVKGYASQTANLTEWQNSSGTVLAKVTSAGNLEAEIITSTSASTFSFKAQDTGMFYFNSRGGLRAPSNGVFTLLDTAETSFGRLQFGGTTSSFPALKRSSATLQARLADDSAYAQFDALGYSVGGSAGASGSFISADAKTVTVTNGIITSIV